MATRTRMLPGGGRERIRDEDLDLKEGQSLSVRKVKGGLVVTVSSRDFETVDERIVPAGSLRVR